VAQITTRDLAQTKEAVAGLLEQLGLSAYLFEVEPRSDGAPWQVRIDCQVSGGWQSLSLPIDVDRLLQSATEGPTRDRTLSEWRTALHGCARGKQE